MGRRKLDDDKRRDSQILLTMTASEKEKLREVAFKLGYLSVSEFVRVVVEKLDNGIEMDDKMVCQFLCHF